MSEKFYVIEDSGQYRGMDWVVRFVSHGHRTGYVKVSDYEKFAQYEKEYDEYNGITSLDVHGGITFMRRLESDNSFGLSEGNWLGFDACHCGDLNDYSTAIRYFGNREKYDILKQFDFIGCGASVKTKEYMIAECKSLIDQILGEQK